MRLWHLKRWLTVLPRLFRGLMWPRKGTYPEYDALLKKVRETGKGMLIGWDRGNYAYEIPDGKERKTVQFAGKSPVTSSYGINYQDQYRSADQSALA